jgi:drug/metabolite transporter (DMT)-like permease
MQRVFAPPADAASRPRVGYMLMVLAFCFAWSSGFPAAKLAIHTAPPLLFLGLRFSLAAMLLLGWAGLRGELKRVPWATLIVLGVVNQAGYQGLAWMGMRSISSGLGTIIASLNPILIAAFAVPLLGERMTGRKALGLLLGFAGAAFVVRNRIVLTGEDPVGILWSVGALLALTIGTLAYKRAAPRASLATAVGVQQAAAAVTLLLAGAATESAGAIAWGPRFWLVMAWFVAVVSIGGLLLWFRLLTRGSASAASSLHFLMPPLGLLMSWAVLGEKLQWLDLAGVAPVALGIWLTTREGRRR